MNATVDIQPDLATATGPISSQGRSETALAKPGARTPVCTAGVDLGSHSAKIVLASEVSNQREVVAAARLVFPSGAMSDITKEVGTLTKWMSEWCSLPVRQVVCSLPSLATEYETAILPSNPADLATAADEALKQMLGPAVDQVTFDYWSTPRDVFGEQGNTLHLVRTGGQQIERVPLEFRKSGVACGVLESTPSLLASVAFRCDDAHRLVVDLGHETATFALVKNRQTLYARHRAAISSQAVVEELTRCLKLSRPAVETLLSDYGIAADAAVVSARLTAGCESWLQSLRFELDRTLAFLDHRNGGRDIHEILLCGGASRLRGLGAWLTERLRIPARAAELPDRCVWSAAQPYSSTFAQAVALLQAETER